jgi:uncharacterized repeat protein (TIGR01451 family)
VRRAIAIVGFALQGSVLVAATIGLVLASAAGADVIPTADLAVVSNTASVKHAKVGDEITFTIIATNNGVDAADFNVMWSSEQLQLVSESCDRGISADTPACEFGVVEPGVTLRTTVVARVVATGDKYAISTGCMVEQAEVMIDPVPQNNCVAATVRIVGKR